MTTTLTAGDTTLLPTLLPTALDARRPAGQIMLTDHYELTMLSAALADGTAAHRAVFELFARKLPKGRRYGVVAGIGRFLDALPSLTFDPYELAWLSSTGVIDADTAAYLADFRFTGNIDGYREGELYFPNSPILTVEATFGEAVVLETLLLSMLNHDSAIASAASRMIVAAGGRPCMDMGSRRTHDVAAVAAARAAYIAGFDTTSNLAAGYTYGIPTRGTSAHAFTLAHADEPAAFASQIATLGVGTTLLVDTYDIAQGIRNAVAAARTADPTVTGPGAIRLDSGDLAAEAVAARALLDELGAVDTRIIVTSDLDEFEIARLADAPVDGYGVGTRLVTGSGAPTAGMVYKLVAIADAPGSDAPLRPVAKRAVGKGSIGGRKLAVRELDDAGHAMTERIVIRYTDSVENLPGRRLQVPMVRAGDVVHTPTLEQVRAHHRGALAELRPMDLHLSAGTPSVNTHLPTA